MYRLSIIIYNIWFHPLAKVPGPWLYAASNIPYAIGLCRGIVWFDIKRFHDQYGPVVRYAPNDVSFITADAWRDIYGHKKAGKANFPKDRRLYREGATDTASILVANDANHSRVRRLVSYAFSEKALRGQEDIMQSYVALLIQRLQKHSKSSTPVLDMNMWYNFTTFDLIGDLAFGEPFGCLESEGYHPWVASIFGGFKLSALNQARKRFPWLMPFTQYLLPRKLLKAQMEHFSMSFAKARQRAMSGYKDREDFMSYILRHNDERGMTPDEIGENSNILIVAGSETTASLLSGTTFFLLKNPASMQQLTSEIRSAFKREEDINLISVSQLKYLLACLDEGLRLYPPVPSALGREVPDGGQVLEGYWIPEKVRSIPSELRRESANVDLRRPWPCPIGQHIIPKVTSVVRKSSCLNVGLVTRSSPKTRRTFYSLFTLGLGIVWAKSEFNIAPSGIVGRSWQPFIEQRCHTMLHQQLTGAIVWRTPRCV